MLRTKREQLPSRKHGNVPAVTPRGRCAAVIAPDATPEEVAAIAAAAASQPAPVAARRDDTLHEWVRRGAVALRTARGAAARPVAALRPHRPRPR